MSVATEDVSYAFAGLTGVVLENVEVRRCSNCGEEDVVLKGMESIHRAIASRLVARPGRLAPEEIRFLRKHLGLNGAQFASQMGVTHETVSRWENGGKIGASAERALRLMAKSFVEHGELPIWLASMETSGDSGPLSLRVSNS